jgi:hypothetical protein
MDTFTVFRSLSPNALLSRDQGKCWEKEEVQSDAINSGKNGKCEILIARKV